MNSILVAGIGIASLLASTVVLGMAYLDMKKHKVNVKDRSSAVIFVTNGDKLVQFTLKIDAVEEK